MPPVSLFLGALLGVGVLLAYRGYRILTDKNLPEPARRRGFWWLNGGLGLIALSALVFGAAAPG